MTEQTRKLYLFVAFLVAANIFDVVNTCYLIENSSISEGNPIVRYLMDFYGCYIGPALLKVPSLLILLWFVRYKQTIWIVGLITTAAVIYAILVFYQLLLLLIVVN